MKHRPDAVDLARRCAAVTELDAQATRRVRDAWDDAFSVAVIESTGKPVFGGYRWHAFAWEFTRAERRRSALDLYRAQPAGEWLVFREHEDQPAFRTSACPPIAFGKALADVYVVPPSFAWTMVFTHEATLGIGPFFSRPEWRSSEPHRLRSGPRMSCRYFACVDHREHMEAGYRWAYWTLEETGLVTLGRPIDVERLLAAVEYWNPPPDDRVPWLTVDVLPEARAFLEQHRGHELVYVDEERLVADDRDGKPWEEAQKYVHDP